MKKLKNFLLPAESGAYYFSLILQIFCTGIKRQSNLPYFIHNSVNLQTTHTIFFNHPLSRLKNLPILNF